MRNDLRNFDGEDEAVGSSGVPVVDRVSRRTAVKRRVHFDRIKMFCVECEVVGGSHSLRIERTYPTCRRERRGTKIDSRFNIWPLNSEIVCRFVCLLQLLHREESRGANRFRFWTL